MNGQFLQSKIIEYVAYLKAEERSCHTIAKYQRDLKAFFLCAEGEVSKETVLNWKEKLIKHYAPSSVNSMLGAVNSFFEWMTLPQLKVKPIKIQRKIFIKPEKELTRDEYQRLVKAAMENGNERLSLVLQTICATGIRVSELEYITVNAAKSGQTMVDCKGKSRWIFLPKALCKSLQLYCRQNNIKNGIVFRTAGKNPLNRSNIWRDMKKLCRGANVETSKVFPHNLRHLFARTFYMLEKDLARLGDLLGHSDISTTRIYTMESGTQHMKQLERMDLVL